MNRLQPYKGVATLIDTDVETVSVTIKPQDNCQKKNEKWPDLLFNSHLILQILEIVLFANGFNFFKVFVPVSKTEIFGIDEEVVKTIDN